MSERNWRPASEAPKERYVPVSWKSGRTDYAYLSGRYGWRSITGDYLNEPEPHQYFPLPDAQSVSDNVEDTRPFPEWRPIETAPRDGTPILGFRHDDNFSDITGMDVVVWESGYGEWFAYGEPIACPPTHWMPLPSPPTSKSEAGDE